MARRQRAQFDKLLVRSAVMRCSLALWRMLVTMQEVVDEINKMKRASSRPLFASWKVNRPLRRPATKGCQKLGLTSGPVHEPRDCTQNSLRRIRSVVYLRPYIRPVESHGRPSVDTWYSCVIPDLPMFIFSSLMTIRDCSRIWEDHPMVGATYTSSFNSIHIYACQQVPASLNRPVCYATRDWV